MTTSKAGAWLRAIPEADAVALISQVEAAHSQLPTLAPGCRAILSGLLWRLDVPGYALHFGSIDNKPVIVSGRLAEAPKPRRKAGKAA